jgi:hypothetical protein
VTVGIPVSQGRETWVDEQDEALARSHKWTLHTGGYAVTRVIAGGQRTSLYLHRLILQAPDGLEVDHINGDPLDNRRCNLRLVTRGQNEQNKRKVRRDSKTGVKNVQWMRASGTRLHGRYQVRLWKDGKLIRIGYYRTLEEASAAAADARRRLYTHAPECSPEVP